ncbi:uncharacterized protein LOC133332959 [Musca vetustissima]|uniref:uncharacterized protein LOC133327591 n=1 Tax=Musca vetustissima TaxID=27455 RepID=UPI002AB6A6CA|nr:uncharacterized protein LOC133327591 [Musca vetustissima]XP_061397307.1 uncharacterized protein LOC133332959 [Musca vetustissima]
MKFIFSIFFILAIIAIGSLEAAKVCVIRVQTCNSKVNVCGRYGRSNLCQRFQNTCALETANCSDNIGYTAVNATYCQGIALNQRRLCNGMSTGTTGGKLLGSTGMNNNNNIQPIVIKTGK